MEKMNFSEELLDIHFDNAPLDIPFDVPAEEISVMEEEPIRVYVKVNTNDEIVEIGSSIFIDDLTGWTYLDEGFGDKFAHAQSQYFEKPLMNDDVSYNYSYIGGRVIEN